MKVIVMTTEEKDSAYKQLNPLVIYYNLTGKRNYLRAAKKYFRNWLKLVDFLKKLY